MSRDPAVFGKGEDTGGNQAVKVEVIHEGLRPGVEHGNKTELARKVPGGVFGECLKCLVDCGKKKIEGDSFVAEDKWIQLMREGEDQMKVAAGKDFCPAVIEPLFFNQGLALGTVPVPA